MEYRNSGVRDAKDSLRGYFDFYNNERPHQSLGYKTPSEVYYAGGINHTCFAGGKHLIRSSVQDTNAVLSHKSLQDAPAEQTHGDLHLKLMKILS